jgi:hypothetical protein
MPTNKKPVLSVLIDGEKRSQFAELCARNSRPMAWAVNAFITRCLEKDSIALGASGAIDILASAPALTVDAEGLAKLREIIIELRQDLKKAEAPPPHLEKTKQDFPKPNPIENIATFKPPGDEDPEEEKHRILKAACERRNRQLQNYP